MRKLVAVLAAVCSFTTAKAPAQEGTFEGAPTEAERKIGLSILRLGSTTGGLIYTSIKRPALVEPTHAGRYINLANSVKHEIEMGRATSGVVRANVNLVAASLTYAAVIDPEPVSKTIVGLAAYGTAQASNYLGDLIAERSEEAAIGMLSRGFEKSNYTADALQAMSPSEFSKALDDLTIGEKTLKQHLSDFPKALELVKAHAEDFRKNVGAAALFSAKKTEASIEQLRGQILNATAQLQQLGETTQRRVEVIERQVTRLAGAAEQTHRDLASLRQAVEKNSRTSEIVARISYMGWTPQQKLEAVKAGMFQELNAHETKLLEASIQSQIDRDNLVRELHQTTRALGHLTQIASSLGLPNDAVNGLNAAQTTASAVMSFASGDYLGGLATIFSLAGIGRPDPAAERHKEMMAFMKKQFAAIDIKLTEILKRQEQTLKLLSELNKELISVRRDIAALHTAVLLNHELLVKLVAQQWDSCFAVRGHLNGRLRFQTYDDLMQAVLKPALREPLHKCYTLYMDKLAIWQQPSKWQGEIIDATHVATVEGKTPEEAKDYEKYRQQLSDIIGKTRIFLLNDTVARKLPSAWYAARRSQPTTESPRVL